MSNKHLDQGIHFMDAKTRHKKKERSVENSLDMSNLFGSSFREGFQESFDQYIQLDEQVLDFGGSAKGEQDKVVYKSLADVKQFIKNKADFWGFEYEPKTKKAIYRSYRDGALPKNDGKIPTVKYAKGWKVFLKPNNGMPESKLATIGEGNAIEKVMARERQDMQKLETSFNNYLNQYKSVYKAYLEEIVAKQGAGSSNVRNSIRLGPDGNKYYITGMGIARQFDAGSWQNRDRTSCPDSSGRITEQDLQKLSRGANMGQGEMCKTGGYNAKSANGEVAWIDSEGLRHVYNDYASRHNTCPKRFTQMSNQKFNAIPNGKTWSDSDQCVLLDLDTEKGRQAQALNDKLIEVAGQMKTLIENSEHKESLVRDEKGNEKKDLLKVLKKVKEKRDEINEARQSIETAKTQYNQQHKMVNSVHLKYIAWTLAGLTIGAMAIRQIRSA